MEMLTLDSDPGQLDRLGGFVDAFCDRHDLPDEVRFHLNVALEELVLNAIKYGRCNPAESAIRLEMWMEGADVRMELCDTGVPFNPLDVPEPDLGGDLAARTIGGLGIHLVRSLMTTVAYERRGSCNYLFLTKTAKREGNGN